MPLRPPSPALAQALQRGRRAEHPKAAGSGDEGQQRHAAGNGTGPRTRTLPKWQIRAPGGLKRRRRPPDRPKWRRLAATQDTSRCGRHPPAPAGSAMGASRAVPGTRRKRRRKAPTARRWEWRRAMAARRNPAAEQAPDHLKRLTMEVGLLHASAGMPQAEPQGACPHGPDSPGSAPTSAGSAHSRRKGRRQPATGG
jgi:hypothetical protein